MPPNRQQQDHGAKRDAILSAAAKLFLRDGYEPTSMKAVAAEAGVTANTVYWYFDDKDALLLAVAEHTFAAVLVDALPHAPTAPVDRLLWLVDQLDAASQLMTAVHARAPLSPTVDAWHEQFHRGTDALLTAEVEAHRAARGLEPMSPAALAALPRLWAFALEGLVTHRVDASGRRALCELLVAQVEAG